MMPEINEIDHKNNENLPKCFYTVLSAETLRLNDVCFMFFAFFFFIGSTNAKGWLLVANNFILFHYFCIYATNMLY